MNLGEVLLEQRKLKHLSQEEVAERLGVTRQTVSKWETGQSTPDFDKILPLCELYGISANELLTGEVISDKELKPEYPSLAELEEIRRNKNTAIIQKRALGICIGILLYFIAVAFMCMSVTFMNPVLASGIFLIIVGFATFVIIYSGIAFRVPKDKRDKSKEKNTLFKQITRIASLITLIVYLLVSLLTMAWHITWIIWIVYALIEEIIKLALSLKGEKNE